MNNLPPFAFQEVPPQPTYGVLIDLLYQAEDACSKNPALCMKHVLATWFHQLYPTTVKITRPCRFETTVRRVAAPVRSSTRGESKLTSTELEAYRKREWTPKLGQQNDPGKEFSFNECEQAGLTPSAIDSYFSHNSPLQQIKTSVKLYLELHQYILLKHRKHSKTDIGNLYKMIDVAHSSTRPDNVYRKIENLYQKNKTNIVTPPRITCTTQSTTHNSSTTQSACKSSSTTPTPLSGHYGKRSVDRRDKRHKALQSKFKEVQHSLQQSQLKVTSTLNELGTTKDKLEATEKNITEVQTSLSKVLDEDLSTLLDHNKELQSTIKEMEKELIDSTNKFLPSNSERDFTIQTKEGTKYLNSIRELYYNLMTIGIAPDKINSVIRTVLNKLCPSIDTCSLKLPGKSCANYMRMAEMPTVSDVHKAISLTKKGQGHINSDGTTLNLRKLIGSSVSGIVLGVQEVADGTSQTMINELDKQFARLRDMANELKIPNANSINWTLIVSSTSDGAATQTKFNKLLQDLRSRDEGQFGPVNNAIKEIIANKCGMHLGVNLRKAQNAGIQEYEKSLSIPMDNFETTLDGEQSTQNQKREYIPIDTFVHAFCKLFGQVGTPEYGQGVTFRDYITNECEKSKSSGDDSRVLYLENVLKTNLERQVGSRYFVTAYNSARIYFLYPAALEFLNNYLSKVKSLNRLEQYVLSKLNDPVMLGNVKIDGLLFFHIYADLTALVKSRKLDKSVFDMNTHYLELLNFLQEVKLHPDRLMDKSTPVFISETRLHTDKKINFREKNMFIYDKLFVTESTDTELLLPRIKAAAMHMTTKISEYKKDQLPGGKYWNPSKEEEELLKQLLPNNDICESILGLNDWISTQKPNLCQKTKSTLVEVKKNKTMTWLETLTEERRDAVVTMAQKKRRLVESTVKEDEVTLRDQRIKKLEVEKKKAEEKEARKLIEIEKLSTIPVIHTVQELQQDINKIQQDKSSTIQGKEKKKLELLKNQVRIRNKLIGKHTKITFSVSGKQKTSDTLIQEVMDMIEKESASQKRPNCSTINSRAKKKKQSATQYLETPQELVGKDIIHRFVNDGTENEELWDGRIIAYNSSTNTHTLTYTGDAEEYDYDLTEDINNGDLWVLL